MGRAYDLAIALRRRADLYGLDREELSGKSRPRDDAHSYDSRRKVKRSELWYTHVGHRRLCRLHAQRHQGAIAEIWHDGTPGTAIGGSVPTSRRVGVVLMER